MSKVVATSGSNPGPAPEISRAERKRPRTWKTKAVSLALHGLALTPLLLINRPSLGDDGGAAKVVWMTAPPAPAPPSEPQASTAPPAESPPPPAPEIQRRQTSPEPPTEPAPAYAPEAQIKPAAFTPTTSVTASADALPTVEQAAAMSSAAAAVAEAAVHASSSGETCNIASWLKGALEDSDEVDAALERIPRQTRSVANAIMLWDGAWVTPPPVALEGVAVVKMVIVAGVEAAPTVCLNQEMRGPLLVPVAQDSEAVLMVIGSGVWRWSDLVATANPAQTANRR